MTLPRARARASPRPLAGLHSTPNSRLQESNLSWTWGWCPGPTQINKNDLHLFAHSTGSLPCLATPLHAGQLLLALT